MRIERIEVDGFGRFSDARWSLEPGLTVLLGANEAGKTTLLNAVRALLFGFEASRDGRAWYPPLAGGRRGGRLGLVTAAGERWTVERHGERGGTGALAVRAPSGNQGGQETLDRLLHGADKDLYNNIFAFGLGELQTFASLSAEGVRGRIYGAGAGLGGTSALDLERRLRQQLDASFVPRGSQRPLNQLLARIEELRREVADLARQPEEHAAAHREREALVTAATTLRQAAATARAELVRICQVRDAVPVVAELGEIESELTAGDVSLDELPEDAVPALDRRLGQLAEARATLAAVDDQLEEARRARDSVRRDPDILAVAGEIDALVVGRSERAARSARRRDLVAGIERQESIVAEQAARAGRWDHARLVALDDSIPSVEATREHEAAMSAAAAVHADAEARRRAAAAAVATEGDHADAAPDDGLDDALAAARELTGLRSTRRSSASPAWLPGVGIGFAVAVAALAAGSALDLVLLGVVLAVAAGAGAAFVTMRRDRRATRDAREHGLLRRLGLQADADDALVAARWEDLTVRRARRDLAGEARERAARRAAELDARSAEATEASARVDAVRAGWAAWLEGHGLPAGTTPDAARQLMAAAGAARRAAQERDALAAELKALDTADDTDRTRIDAVCATVGMPRAPDDAGREARLAGLGERLDHARAAERALADLETRIGTLEARRAPAATVVEERAAAVVAHLRLLRCEDPETLRRRSNAAARRRQLQASVREHRARLGGIAGGPTHVEGLLHAVRDTDPATLAGREIDLGERLQDLESQERAATARIGALEARIRDLEAAEELGVRRQELAALEGRAAAMAREWSVRAVALRLLQETRARYERERQPDVVRAAESHFERITGGRYVRIVAPPGDASVRVETEGGESRAVDELSRGTAEQLYLALRFGLIEEFARSAEPLPVVMDDILVNFDAERSGRAASAIRQLAARHQVLYFTCHRWTADLLDADGERTIALG